MGQNRSRTVFLFAGADAGAATSIRAVSLSLSPSLSPSRPPLESTILFP